jgi:hypothetical protein
MIPLYGSLASTWPLGGGVLVDQGVVYAAAGNATFDGTHVYALDAQSGKIRWQNHTSGNTGKEMPENGVGVQGPMLLHQGAVYMAAGNKPTVASYAVADGKFAAAGAGRGKDLFVRRGQVRAAGYPLYWRPEDDQFLSPMELETPAGVFGVTTTTISLLAAQADPKAPPVWSDKPYQEIAAVAVAKNAVLVTGLDRDPKDPQKSTAGLTALSLEGKPAAWGLAMDRGGRMVVALVDGRVICFDKE